MNLTEKADTGVLQAQMLVEKRSLDSDDAGYRSHGSWEPR